ncbi:diaminopimelate decarboxylase [Anaerosalibacter bizertensis]|uniref:Diaminopimelate decarboxylase n=1 Tax=Anaerosalibacter bizertensis TaxID=932217 RepID=A0A844FE92_9FIRM|nr:diaminopimelate decarboxylase [Anaerosalibacter bizertensis]MCB5558914.1 diaminopimelate decarboxylase [Anaerosalibacter bizertensis]MCG4564859.1 diaminopimelate decarboxylase [Anaerosalibacter bizertensis]MCG4584393.1 diaminopimelate decarboxylase [Anaerosalibacter bizertensis]MSS42313.1 diaminopimelate decarboxylase [Anaerosalibacter bizertensis]
MANFLFSNTDTVKLAEKYGTPLYVVSEDIIVERCNEIKRDFTERHKNTMAVYASKAFLTKEMARIIKREGLGMDVVSGGELYTAIKVDFPMEKIVFHGNNKTLNEIEMAVKHNVGRIVVDNFYELDLLGKVAKKYKKKANILFRITPGVDSHTHKYIRTGQIDSKFGIPLNENIIHKAILKAMELEYVELKGFHFHIGSQLQENETHVKAIKIIASLMNEVKNDIGFITKELNTGGGYGIHYNGNEHRKPLRYFTDAIMEELEKECEKYNLERPKVIIEPGRWIVGEAGITLYTIGSIKNIPGIRTYVGIDGGMPDNPRPSLYNAKYEALVANKMDEEPKNIVTVAGKCCESGDILIWDLKVPYIESGDILAVLSTGAYNYSMASNYNRIPRPAVVMVSNGKDRLIVKRETYDDIIKNEI